MFLNKQMRLARLHHRWVRANGWTLYTRCSGALTRCSTALGDARLPIVLVHGLVVSSLYMVPTAGRLAPYFPVFAPDLPGFGQSSKPNRTLTIPELADVLGAWMNELEMERTVVAGNSLGCQVAVDFAARYPERVAGAVLAAPTMDSAARTTFQQAMRLLADLPLESPMLMGVQVRDFLEAGYYRTWRSFQHALHDPIDAKLQRIECPVLVVRGANDPISPQRWCEEVARLVPDGRLVVLPNAPHAVNYSSPAEFAGVVRSFVEERVRVGSSSIVVGATALKA